MSMKEEVFCVYKPRLVKIKALGLSANLDGRTDR